MKLRFPRKYGQNPFKRFIKVYNLNKDNEFNNHLVEVVKKMNTRGFKKIDTLFKTFYFTVERLEGKYIKNKYFVSNQYYNIGINYKVSV